MPKKEIQLWLSVESKLVDMHAFQYTQPAKIREGALQLFYGGTPSSKVFGSTSFPFYF